MQFDILVVVVLERVSRVSQNYSLLSFRLVILAVSPVPQSCFRKHHLCRM